MQFIDENCIFFDNEDENKLESAFCIAGSLSRKRRPVLEALGNAALSCLYGCQLAECFHRLMYGAHKFAQQTNSIQFEDHKTVGFVDKFHEMFPDNQADFSRVSSAH